MNVLGYMPILLLLAVRGVRVRCPEKSWKKASFVAILHIFGFSFDIYMD